MQICSEKYIMKKKSTKLINIEQKRIELYSLRKSLLNLNFQKSSGQLEKTSEIKKTRRKIASLMTNINLNLNKENNNA
tara:strand:- start:254 stop:487 length:234 start_codon:yes stop_codon:yes gene_type:complete